MLHTEPDQTRTEKKVTGTEIQKAQGRCAQSSQTKENLFVYWDSVTMQDTGVHVPNLLCTTTSNCDDLYRFEGTTCIQDFMDWLRELALDFKLTVLAHNSQGFDSYSILDEHYQQYVVPEQVVNRAKILSISINGGDIVFKDSLCFFQMPKSAFPRPLDS